ncbi:MAG: chemotaxis protein CheA [Clostridia bacterium]|nr:chemotaxis protein CheA [Clostridia bacterium]
MSDFVNYCREPMLEMYIFEANQLMEQLEEILLNCEKACGISKDNINEIFRIMHTIKGSSAMMMFSNIASVSHNVEDLFYFIREKYPQHFDCTKICDLIFAAMDFIKRQICLIEAGKPADEDEAPLAERIKEYLEEIKKTGHSSGQQECASRFKDKKEEQEAQKFYISKYEANQRPEKKYSAKIFFADDCQMENIRAFTVVHNLKEHCREICHLPEDLFNNDSSREYIVKNGFTIYMVSDLSYEELLKLLNEALFVKQVELKETEQFDLLISEPESESIPADKDNAEKTRTGERKSFEASETEDSARNIRQNLISVNIQKLDKLMDIVGELVIAESMVTHNPDLEGLQLDNFNKSARQLAKLTDELQDIVMSIRMLPVAATFNKMHRIVRDMSKKLGKEVKLLVAGEETEVDKNIIDHLSDPLMHLVRNAIDHGIETPQQREACGKPREGSILMEARNEGSDVVVTIKDDGKGLDREKILERAVTNGLINKDAGMTDREIFNLIMLPGFSTKEAVTEFSGRGVGMDVVLKNIEAVGGTVCVDSVKGKGTAITLRIPLTLAIIDGMNIGVGKARYTIPINSIRESFRPVESQLISDPDGNEMIMVRGQCYPIIRLHERFKVETDVKDFTKGILIMAEQEGKTACIFADELLGQQQVVVKALPDYIKRRRDIPGLSGCTLLGDGSISLIIHIGGLLKERMQKERNKK